MSKSRGVERASARAVAVSPAGDEDETQLVREEAALLPPVTGCVPFHDYPLSVYRRVKLAVRGQRPRARQQSPSYAFAAGAPPGASSAPTIRSYRRMVVVYISAGWHSPSCVRPDKTPAGDSTAVWLFELARLSGRKREARVATASYGSSGSALAKVRRPGDLWAPENQPSWTDRGERWLKDKRRSLSRHPLASWSAPFAW
jgi:hypothetical protein